MERKSAMIRARVHPKLKRDAEKVLAQLGLGASEAISMFYAQIAHRHALPFSVSLDEQAAPQHTPRRGSGPTINEVYRRLEELDEWRRFSSDLSSWTLKK